MAKKKVTPVNENEEAKPVATAADILKDAFVHTDSYI
jgi:hypothetical protein